MTEHDETTDDTAVQLAQQLATLQQSASVVADQMRGTNLAFYGHLSELYVWWRSASAADGYLEAEYANTGRKYKKKSSRASTSPRSSG